MENLTAMARGNANRGKELMVFDWNKAAKIIKKRKVKNASAGLSGDWEYTGGKIFKNGKIIPKEKTYVYLASTWAIPELEIDGKIIECYKMQNKTPKWDAHTYFPKSAREILKG